ncbi:MAG: hypothetical protein HGA72_02710 [Chlorobiaceae bacterium]|nr:hypothetical protein [Chlorobiaceae bacterium]NTW62932.1 hypothetical protein [Chlorobiaceae bacterium]
MLRLDELRAGVKGEFFLKEELHDHNVRKVDALADVIIKPAGKKELGKLLNLLQKAGYPHVVINSKGRVQFPDQRFHGAVIVTDLKF